MDIVFIDFFIYCDYFDTDSFFLSLQKISIRLPGVLFLLFCLHKQFECLWESQFRCDPTYFQKSGFASIPERIDVFFTLSISASSHSWRFHVHSIFPGIYGKTVIAPIYHSLLFRPVFYLFDQCGFCICLFGL